MNRIKRNFLEIALRQINASCPEKIDSAGLVGCIRKGRCEKKWQPHIYAFLEELPVELIHDIVLSDILNFEELGRAVEIWECTDGPTTGWIRKMAALSMETKGADIAINRLESLIAGAEAECTPEEAE